MNAFKLLMAASCFLGLATSGVAKQDYSKSEGLLQYVDPISAPVFTGMYLSERVFRTAWCNSDPTIFIKAGIGVRDIIIPTVF